MKKTFKALIFSMFALLICVLPSKALGEYKGSSSVIDTSDAAKGYFSARYTAGGTTKIKVMVEKDGAKYTYDLKADGTTEKYPLQLGDGKYKIRVLRNTSGTKYATVQTVYENVTLESPFAPYLHSNQYVNYTADTEVVKTAAQLISQSSDRLTQVDSVYKYVTDAMTYDKNKAATVQSGYLPNVDQVVADKKGICFDYASVMAAMLRSQGIPTKLVTGYVAPNNAYHAWNEVWVEGKGWVKTGSIYFDGVSWTLMDPTFTSAGKDSKYISNFIGDGTNYTKKYEY